MDKLIRTLLDDRQQMVDGLTAIRDGHEESVAFINSYDSEGKPRAIPKTTVESIQLAESVATLALGGLRFDTYTGPLLRAMLLKFGDHMLGCPGELPITDECTCSWSNVMRGLTSNAYTDVDGKVTP